MAKMILFRYYHAIFFLLFSAVVIYFTIPSDRDLGLYYFNSFEYEKAIAYLHKENDVHGDDVFVLKKLKDYSLIQGDVKKAYLTQMKLVSLKPRNKDYLVEAEKLAGWSEKTKEQLKLKERRARLELESDSEKGQRLLLEVAQGYRYIKDFENADRVFKDVSNFDNRMALEVSIRYFLARKDVETSENLLMTYSQKFPKDTEFNNFYIQTLVFQEKYEEAALNLVEKLFPGSLLKSLNLSLVNEILRKKEKTFFTKERFLLESLALNLFKVMEEGKGVESDSFISFFNTYEGKHPYFYRILLSLLKENQELEFIKNISSMLRKEAQRKGGESYREAHFNLAEIFVTKKEYSEAIYDLVKLTKRFPLNRRYWEMLGETYELNGEKKKSIKAYFKLYQLQKKKADQSFLQSLSEGFLLADSDKVPVFLSYPKSPNPKSFAQKKLQSVEDRLIDSIYSLDNPKEKLAAFEDLLKESPTSIGALKGKAYSLFELGRSSEGLEIFSLIYTSLPMDSDANRALLGDWINNEEWEKVENAEEVLSKSLSQQEKDIAFRDYYYKKRPDIYREFCQKTSDQSSRVDCLYREGSVSDALEIVREVNRKEPANCEFFMRRMYLETENGDLDWSIKQKGKNPRYYSCTKKTNRREIENFVLAQNQLRRNSEFWRVETSVGLLETDQFKLGDFQLGVMKKQKTWAMSLESRHDQVVWRGDSKFQFLSLGITTFFKNGGTLTVGPTQTMGDKSSSLGVFARYFINRPNVFFSGEVFTHKPLRFTRALALEPTAYGVGSELYSNYRSTNREFSLIGFANIQNVYFQERRSFFSQLTIEGHKRVFNSATEKPLELLAGAQLSNSNLSNAQPFLKDSFLNKSLALHGVIKLDYNYPENFFPREWSGFVRLGFGGDFLRNIDFFKSIQATGQINRAIGKRTKVFFLAEYYSEFLGVNRGNTGLCRLGFLRDF